MDTGLAVDLWLEALTGEGKSPTTISNYRRFTGWLPSVMPTIEEDGRLAIRRALAEYRVGHSPETVRTVYVAWHAFFAWCTREGWIDRSPMEGMRTPKVPDTPRRPYSASEIRAVLAYLKTQRTPIGLRNTAIVTILVDGGLRASELCRLAIDDVLDDQLLLRQTKAARPRMAPLGAKANLALRRYVNHGRPKLSPKGRSLIVNQFGNPIDRYGLRQILERIGDKAGVHLSAHRLRHTWATMHLQGGTPTETLRRLGGWSVGSAMVTRYAHLTTDDLRAAQLRASPIDRL